MGIKIGAFGRVELSGNVAVFERIGDARQIQYAASISLLTGVVLVVK